MHGNRITANASQADDGKLLIEKALIYIHTEFGWEASGDKPLFSGVYYDAQKVGSFIVKVGNKAGDHAVLKLQLRPLPFDEGFIIRHIEEHNTCKEIQLPKILADVPWNEELGFGFLLFDDLSDFQNLWSANRPTDEDRQKHGEFLKKFFNQVLPMKPWLDPPNKSIEQIYKDSFEHFYEVAKASKHNHVDFNEVDTRIEKYFEIQDQVNLGKLHFTHGHLSGHDIKYNPINDQYTLLANLYWSYRPKYYELIFPMWVDLMHLEGDEIDFKSFFNNVLSWLDLGSDIYNEDLHNNQNVWLLILQRAALTIMLDLGSSEWQSENRKNRSSLLKAWESLFDWIIENKFK